MSRTIEKKPSNIEYYCSDDGGEIMSSRNFNDGVISLLRIESAFVSKALNSRKYSALLEMGCDLARNYDVAKMHNLEYLGVDIRTKVIDVLKERSTRISNPFANATFMNDDLRNINNLINKSAFLKPVLCLFPFNLIGNFNDIENLFSIYAEAGVDLIISSWQRSSKASIARFEYYSNCGITNVDFSETDISHTFSGQTFVSEAYSNRHLISIANESFVLQDQFSNEIIQCLYFQNEANQ